MTSEPAKPRKSRAKAPKRDGWVDLGTETGTLSPVVDYTRGLGLETQYTAFRRTRELGPEEIRGLYGDGIGRRIVEIPVHLALGSWPSLDVAPEYREAAERVEDAARALDAQRWVSRAAVWARRDGWSLSIQGWRTGDDLQLWREPRAPALGDLIWVRPAYRWDCANPTDYFGPDSPHFGQVRWISVHRMRPDVEGDVGYLQGSALGAVHGSRFTRLATPTGRSEYERVAQYLAQLLAGGGGVAGALARANVGVFSIPEWAQKVRRNDAEAYGRIRSHFEALSSFAPLVLDAGSNGKPGETFEMIANSALGGTENALFALSWLTSAATGIPMVELFGLEPGGFSGGEETTARWYDSLHQIRVWATPTIRSIYDGLWARELGRPAVPRYELSWAPLRAPTLEQRATLVTSLVSGAEKAIGLGLTTPAAVRAGLAATPDADLWAWEVEPTAAEILDPTTHMQTSPLAPAAAETALNGAQTASFVQVLQEVAAGRLDPVAARGLLQIAFPAAGDALIAQVVAAQAVRAPTPVVAPAPAAPAAEQAAPEVTDAEGPEPTPPPGTWLEAEEAGERSGIAPRKIKGLGRRGQISRRKLGSRWEYRLEDLYRVAAESVEGALPDDDDGPVEDEDPAEYVARAYAAYHEAVNMSAKELRAWAETECSGKAGLSRDPLWRNVRLLETPREKWTAATARSAMRTVSFVARMRGAENGEEVCGGWSKREISLRNWAYNPGQ